MSFPFAISRALHFLVFPFSTLTALAVDGDWTLDGTGDWSNTSNWDSGIVASGPGALADFQNGWANTINVDLDVDATVGKLTFRDNGSVNRNMVLFSSSGKVLTLAGGGVQSPPEVEAANRRLTVQVPLAGSEGVLFRSNSAAYSVRVEAQGVYTGGTTVAPAGGKLEVMVGGRLGEGMLLVQDDGDAADTDVYIAHAGAILDFTPMVLETNAKVDLDFIGNIPLSSLQIGGVTLGSRTYGAGTHPSAFSGTGTVSVLGGSGAWIDTTTTNVSWTDPAMWSGGNVAYGVDAVADFHNGGQDHIVGKTVDLSSEIVVGQIIWRDSGNPNRNVIFSSLNSGRFRLDTSSGSPLLWARNRSMYFDVELVGDDGLELQSDQSTQSGVTLRHRNSYTGVTTIIDAGGAPTITYPGDFGNSHELVVKGNLSDAAVELILNHGQALKPTAAMTVESGALVNLNFGGLFPGTGDRADMYVSQLTLGGAVQPVGIYSAATHPAYFTGEGEVVVQATVTEFSTTASGGAGATTDLSWPSLYGQEYDIEECTDLLSGVWTKLATEPGLPPTNAVNVTMPSTDHAFYRIGERTEYLSSIRAGVIKRVDGFITNNYLPGQNTTVGDIRHGQFHNSDNMRQSECTPVLVWAYLNPDSIHYQNPAALDSAIYSMDYMVRAQGINGGYNEFASHGWCGVPVRTNGKSSVVGFTTYGMGNAIRLMASIPAMSARLMENIDANGIAGDGPLSDGNETQRLAAWSSMLSQVMPFQFSGSGRGHAPNQDLCALAGVYAVNEAYAALNGGALLKTPAEIAVLSNEIFHGQPSAASARPNGEWWSSTGMLGEGGHDHFGYDDNYGSNVSLVFLGYLAPRDPIAAAFLTNEYAEALQYFFVPDQAAPLGMFSEWGISRRGGSAPYDPKITPLALCRDFHPAMARLYDIALPYFAAAPEANMSFASPHFFQIGVWGYCEFVDSMTVPTGTTYKIPAERNEAFTFQDTTMKILATKPVGGVPTYYTEVWDDPNMARRHVWGQAPETVTSQGLFP